MFQTILFFLFVFGIPASVLGQTTPGDMKPRPLTPMSTIKQDTPAPAPKVFKSQKEVPYVDLGTQVPSERPKVVEKPIPNAYTTNPPDRLWNLEKKKKIRVSSVAKTMPTVPTAPATMPEWKKENEKWRHKVLSVNTEKIKQLSVPSTPKPVVKSIISQQKPVQKPVKLQENEYDESGLVVKPVTDPEKAKYSTREILLPAVDD